MDDELQFPEVIIHHIQSFLDRRQSARASVLSKSWYSAWSTRPILDFDDRDFQIAEVFAEFVNRTMQRYHELKLKIEDFRLRIKVTNSDSGSLVNEFIMRALLQLKVSNFSLEISGFHWKYVLPVQVFEAKSLIKLSVAWCKIDQKFDGGMVCSNLESLSLNKVFIGDDMIRDIMLRCPSLKSLYLSECMGLFKVNLSTLHNLKKFSVTKCRDCNLEFPLIEFEGRTVGSSICNRFTVPAYDKLSCLLLEQVKIDDFFFHDFSSKFPCLEDLYVRHCYGYKDIKISSRSLKYISLMHEFKLEKAEFEVPSICKFKLSAVNIPSLSFMTSSREYESHISFEFTYWSLVVGDCWYLDLKKFLTELRRSRTSVSIIMFLDKWGDRGGNNRGYPIPVVENLMIKFYPSTCLWWSDIFDDVFWSCRPKFITFCDDVYNLKTRKLLCKFLVQQASRDYFDSIRKFTRMNDLEEVNVEFFEETLKEWRPVPCIAFLCSSTVKENEQFRFRLKWRAC